MTWNRGESKRWVFSVPDKGKIDTVVRFKVEIKRKRRCRGKGEFRFFFEMDPSLFEIRLSFIPVASNRRASN